MAARWNHLIVIAPEAGGAGALFDRGGVERVPNSGARGYSYLAVCGRCGGAGGSEAWRFTGWTCYECGGAGSCGDKLAKLYSADELAKLNAVRDARRAKVEAGRAAKAAEERAAAVAAVAGNWAAFKAEWPACADWLGANAPASEFAASLMRGVEKYGSLSAAQLAAVLSNVESAKAAAGSKYVGEVGKRAVFKAKVEKILDWSFGSYPRIYRYCYLLRDAAGNAIKYVGSSDLGAVGDMVEFKASVAEHADYRGEAQTLVKRPALVRAESEAACA